LGRHASAGYSMCHRPGARTESSAAAGADSITMMGLRTRGVLVRASGNPEMPRPVGPERVEPVAVSSERGFEAE